MILPLTEKNRGIIERKIGFGVSTKTWLHICVPLPIEWVTLSKLSKLSEL